MEPTKIKGSVLRAASDRLQAIEHELRERVNELKAVTIGDDNAESASQTESTHGSDVDVMNSLGEQIARHAQELLLLQSIDPNERHSQVQFGSVVHAGERSFLVATGIDEFTVNGRTYLGISPRAPLFQALQGRHEGETVLFNKVEYRIEEIH